MGRFSKLFGAAAGTALGQGIGDPLATILSQFMDPHAAQAVGKIVEIVLPIIGTYFAPANK